MSVMQATSLAFQTSCEWCKTVRAAVTKPAMSLYQGILLGRQLHANYRVAEQLAGRGDYRGMTVYEVANLINKQTI
jgi:hypothetical protein